MNFCYPIAEDTVLCILEARHTQAFYEVLENNRAHLERWISWMADMHSAAAAGQIISRYLRKFCNGEGLMAGIWCDDALAGGVLYRRLDHVNRVAEIGYWLGSEYLGRGLASRACAAMVDYAFTELAINRVELLCGVDNAPSRAVPERLNFRAEGVLRQAAMVAGKPMDMVLYAMLAADWVKP